MQLPGRLRSLSPDVVVMDIGMRGLNGVEATRQIKTDEPAVQVVALSTHSDHSYVRGMLESGASGYVLKTAAVDELCRAVRAVAEGKHYLSPDITGWWWRGTFADRRRPAARRTPSWDGGNARSFSFWRRATAPRRSPGESTSPPALWSRIGGTS
jgi:DNA-binding NarL/FixJ family response regulator